MKKIILLLSVLALSALVVCCLFHWGNGGLTERGRRFKAELGLDDFRGPGDRYTWTCPSSVMVSNQTFKTADVTFNGKVWRFGLKTQDGVEKAVALVYIASSADAAVDELCNHLERLQRADYMIRKCSASKDERGNVLLQRSPRLFGVTGLSSLEYHRTYGNLFIEVMVPTRCPALCAKDFALPLLEAGASKR